MKVNKTREQEDYRIKKNARRQAKRQAERQQQLEASRESLEDLSSNFKIISFIPRGVSPLRVALKFAKSCGEKGFQPERLCYLNPTMFNSQKIVASTITTLCRNKFLAKGESGAYLITTRGTSSVYLLAQREPSQELA